MVDQVSVWYFTVITQTLSLLSTYRIDVQTTVDSNVCRALRAVFLFLVFVTNPETTKTTDVRTEPTLKGGTALATVVSIVEYNYDREGL